MPLQLRQTKDILCHVSMAALDFIAENEGNPELFRHSYIKIKETLKTENILRYSN